MAGTNREFTQKLQTVENSRTPSSAASAHYTRREHTKKQKKTKQQHSDTFVLYARFISIVFVSIVPCCRRLVGSPTPPLDAVAMDS